ncbi:MAG: YtxH domain-containing protein [Anaerolineaceae bacterium]|nr:MAG: YtxH domain-containing protein [Anaerolineaceae bacterium]
MNDRIYYSQEAEKQAKRERTVLALAAAIMGIGLGAVLALIFAPQSGDKTRQQIEQQAREWMDQGEDAAQQAVSKVRKIANDS